MISPNSAELSPPAVAVLPDLVAPNLDIMFCGTAAGTASAAKRAYYAGPGNAFWPALFRAGLTPYALKPEEYPHLARWNLGLTDLAKHVFGSDRTLQDSDYDVARLRLLVAAVPAADPCLYEQTRRGPIRRQKRRLRLVGRYQCRHHAVRAALALGGCAPILGRGSLVRPRSLPVDRRMTLDAGRVRRIVSPPHILRP